MRIKLALALAFLLVIAGVWFFYQTAAVASRGGEDTPLYSTERHDPYGTAALKDLLAERGVPTSVLTRPAPEESTGAVLIEVLPRQSQAFGPAPELQTERLKAWMLQGNTVILFTRSQTPLMTQYNLKSPAAIENLRDIEDAEAHGKPQAEIPADERQATWTAAPVPTGGVLRAQGTLTLYAPLVLAHDDPGAKGWQPLAVVGGRHAQSDWVAAARSIGTGRLIVVGAPTPILNGTLNTGVNLDFVLALIAPPDKLAKTPVIFDEWSHGLGHEGTVIGFIREVGLVPCLLQLFFVVALYVWATSGFSPPDPGAVKRRRSSTEQIEVLGHLYRQAMKPSVAFEKVYAEVRRRIAGVLSCTPGTIEATLGHVPPPLADKARMILRRLDDIGRGGGPACPGCGYDLTGNQSGTCPECGAAISWQLKEQIAHAAEFAAVPERQKHVRKTDALLAAVLKESYLFTEESARERYRRR